MIQHKLVSERQTFWEAEQGERVRGGANVIIVEKRLRRRESKAVGCRSAHRRKERFTRMVGDEAVRKQGRRRMRILNEGSIGEEGGKAVSSSPPPIL